MSPEINYKRSESQQIQYQGIEQIVYYPMGVPNSTDSVQILLGAYYEWGYS